MGHSPSRTKSPHFLTRAPREVSFTPHARPGTGPATNSAPAALEESWSFHLQSQRSLRRRGKLPTNALPVFPSSSAISIQSSRRSQRCPLSSYDRAAVRPPLPQLRRNVDSLLLGEAENPRTSTRRLSLSHEHGATGPVSIDFSKALETGKRVRPKTELGTPNVGRLRGVS